MRGIPPHLGLCRTRSSAVATPLPPFSKLAPARRPTASRAAAAVVRSDGRAGRRRDRDRSERSGGVSSRQAQGAARVVPAGAGPLAQLRRRAAQRGRRVDASGDRRPDGTRPRVLRRLPSGVRRGGRGLVAACVTAAAPGGRPAGFPSYFHIAGEMPLQRRTTSHSRAIRGGQRRSRGPSRTEEQARSEPLCGHDTLIPDLDTRVRFRLIQPCFSSSTDELRECDSHRMSTSNRANP